MTFPRPISSRPRLSRAAVVRVLVAGLLALPSGSAHAQATASPPPCAAADHRSFDFWVGTWDVYRPDGTLAGRNVLTREMSGCVLHESYTTPQGYHGESFNVFDASRGVWHQTWVDNTGTLLLLEGGIRDGAMVLEGETVGQDGSAVLHRITWSRIDGRSDRVRQLWETSSDRGTTWAVAFDGEYRRQG